MNKKLFYFCISYIIILFAASNILLAQTSESKDDSSNWKAPKSANKMKNPLAGIIEATKKGKKLFSDNCFECHGDSGTGNGPSADMLDPKPADFTSVKVQKQSDGALFWKISEGDNGAMASYKGTFNEKERWQLVNYIRQLSKESKKKKN